MSRLRRWLVGLLVLAVVLAFLCTGLGWWAVHHLDTAVTRVPMDLESMDGRAADSPGLDVLLLLSAPLDQEGSPIAWADGGPLISAMIVHVDADRAGLGLVALPVATLAHAASRGPVPVTEAVETTTGIHLDHVAVLRWNAIAGLVNSSDGVVVELPGGVAGWAPGPRTLDPDGAWEFVRDYPGPWPGASGVARRMQLLLRTLLEGSLHQEMVRNPWQLWSFLDDVAHGLVVDKRWHWHQMGREGWSLRHRRSFDIRFVVAPTDDDGNLAPDVAATLWTALRDDALDLWMGSHPEWETSRRL